MFSLTGIDQEGGRKFTEWVGTVAADAHCDALYATSEIPLANLVALENSSSRLKVFYPGQDLILYDFDCLRSCIRAADLVIFNKVEATAASRVLGVAVDSLPDVGPITAVVVTEGAAGSVAYTRGESLVRVPACIPHRLLSRNVIIFTPRVHVCAAQRPWRGFPGRKELRISRH